ncbi:MAG TPA: Uma2 family endonuclease [Thermoanaerobaculia bacterium]|jgi:Uma2 family endonuclease|nr:Uma2 family endonuclease [Thermoanaerobaculia bacterium]
MVTAVIRKVSYDEFQTLPRDGSKRFELIEGEVFMTPSPNTKHQIAASNLHFAIRKFIEEKDLGRVFFAPYDVVFSKWTALEPDLLFIRRKRLSIITDANVQGVPDLVIEILSPGNKAYDRETKHRVYEQAGVPEIWYVDPEERSVEILNLARDRGYERTAKLSGNDAIVSNVLPGFSLTLDEVFAS